MATIMPYESFTPQVDPSVFVAPTASVIGNVRVGKGSSIWFNTVVRGDIQSITIGDYTNLQDNVTVHVMGDQPITIGDYVMVGHNAVVHCASIGNNCLIGMGAILLGYSDIGDNCIIGAGTLLTQGRKIPPNSMVYGNPARIIRSLRDDEIEALRQSVIDYKLIAAKYMEK